MTIRFCSKYAIYTISSKDATILQYIDILQYLLLQYNTIHLIKILLLQYITTFIAFKVAVSIRLYITLQKFMDLFTINKLRFPAILLRCAPFSNLIIYVLQYGNILQYTQRQYAIWQ